MPLRDTVARLVLRLSQFNPDFGNSGLCEELGAEEREFEVRDASCEVQEASKVARGFVKRWVKLRELGAETRAQ